MILTHLHADHASGIEGLAFYAYYLLGLRIPLLATPSDGAALERADLKQRWERLTERFPAIRPHGT